MTTDNSFGAKHQRTSWTPTILSDLSSAGNGRYEKDVIARLIKIRDAATKERSGAPPRGTLDLDPHRTAKTLLLDGNRGSGKTTVLLRALHEISGVVGREQGLFVVSLLDLEVLSAAIPVASHMLIRLREFFLSHLELNDGQIAKLEDHWERAWEGTNRGFRSNIEGRSSRLDAPDYQWAVHTAAQRNLEYVHSFRVLMNALIEVVSQNRLTPDGGSISPLLIVAIDDADMQPAMTADLIEVVRKFWHPNLAFVLAGDGDLFRTTLTKHYAKELPDDVRAKALATTLAVEAFDKSIPAGHRIPMEGSSIDERWQLIVNAIAAENLETSAELETLIEVGPHLRSAIPEHYRERNELITRMLDSVRSREGDVEVEDLATFCWRAADSRGLLPDLSGDSRPISVSRASLGDGSGVFVADPTRLRHREFVVEGKQLTPTNWSRPDAVLALKAYADFAGTRIDAESARVPTLGLLVPARLLKDFPAALPPDRLRIGNVLADVGAFLDFRAQLRLLALAKRSTAAGSSLSRLDAVRAAVQFATEREFIRFDADGTLSTWEDFLSRRRPAREERAYFTALLSALPECGLDPDDANQLLDDVCGERLPTSEDLHKLTVQRRTHIWLNGSRVENIDKWLKQVDDASPQYRASNWYKLPVRNDAALIRAAFPSADFRNELLSKWSIDGAFGLQRYVNDSRAQHLAQASAQPEGQAQLEAFAAIARDTERMQGGGLIALRRMWEVVGGDGMRTQTGAPWIDFGGDVPICNGGDDGVLRRLNAAVPTAVEVSDGRFAEVSTGILGSVGRALPTVQHVVLTIVRDVQTDLEDTPKPPPRSKGAAPVVTASEPEFEPFGLITIHSPARELLAHWPLPSVAPIDTSALAQQWNNHVNMLHELKEHTRPSGDARVRWPLDYLAITWLESIRYIGENRRNNRNTGWSYDPLSDQINSVSMRPSTNGMMSVVGARSQRFGDVVRVGVPLLCLPEHGLSKSIANKIFSTWHGSLRHLDARYMAATQITDAQNRSAAEIQALAALRKRIKQSRSALVVSGDGSETALAKWDKLDMAEWLAVRWLLTGNIG